MTQSPPERSGNPTGTPRGSWVALAYHVSSICFYVVALPLIGVQMVALIRTSLGVLDEKEVVPIFFTQLFALAISISLAVTWELNERAERDVEAPD